VARARLSTAWIRALAEPYLRGYRAERETGGSLRGYWFRWQVPRGQTSLRRRGSAAVRSQASFGFFVGYLLHAGDYDFLAPEPPECLVFAFVQPVGGGAHRRLVRRPESLMRKTFHYIRWLTHRPPRFAFFDREIAAMVRHNSMRDWPPNKYQHFSRNFFIETLAWLVRSGLVGKLREEALRSAGAGRSLRLKNSPHDRESWHGEKPAARQSSPREGP